MNRNDYTGLIYANPTPLEGFARVLDLGGQFDDYNDSTSPEEADWMAVTSDWYAVGADLYRAILRYAAKAGPGVTHGERR